jgi:glucose/arabinose dehydrogenase
VSAAYRTPRLAAAFACALVAALIAAFCASSTAIADPALPAGFQDEVAFPGLSKPTAVRFAPNEMVFVAEKNGKIQVFEDLDDETPELFKNLTVETYDHGDRGLLGLAVDPGFPAQPYVYALFTYDHVIGSGNPAPEWGSTLSPEGDDCPDTHGADDCVVSGRLVRYTADVTTDGEGLHAVASDEKVLIAEDWCQQFSSHSIGDLRFGPEGALYAGGGDGANFSSADYGQFGSPPNPCDDPEKEGGSLRSQDLRTPETDSDPTGLNGTIIRIDPETGKGWPGNPLAGKTSENEKRIVALGFRNPFRFTLDPETGEMYVANVGSSEFEELDRFDPGAGLYNSGWPCYEGTNKHFLFKTFGLSICEGLYAEPQLVSPPLFYYSHKSPIAPGDECSYSSGSAISGPAFYEGADYPSKYKGALFFADSVRNCFYVMLPGADGRPDPDKIEPFMTGGSLYPGIDIQEGPDGALYYASLFGEGFSKGAIHRITYAPGAPRARISADKQYGPTPLEVTFSASGSTDPEGKPLEYEWDLNGDGVFETIGGETRSRTYTQAELEKAQSEHKTGNVVVSLRVKDAQGLTNTAKLTLYPGDTPPTVTINAPTAGTEWGVGDTIHLSGYGESGGSKLDPLYNSWSTRVLHCPFANEPNNCHSHPLQDFPGVWSADLVAPEHDYPSFIEITLTSSDKRGLSASKTIKLPAREFVVHIASSPSGIPLSAGLVAQATPFDVPSVEGAQLVLNAPPTYDLGGRTYTWQSWSDGGAISHTVLAQGPTSTYTAVYTAPGEEPPAGGGSSGGGGSTPPGPIPPPPPTPKVPDTKLGRHPLARTAKTTATFTFSATVGGAAFSCKLDGKPKAACRSPKAYKKLKPGRHTFKVWASAGVLTDPTPAKFSWKVLRPKR